jgi:hypothetical protein
VLKSGMAAFQQQQTGTVLGYYALGTVDPAEFPDWTSFRQHIHALMSAEKPRLDERVHAASAAAAPATEKTMEMRTSIGV